MGTAAPCGRAKKGTVEKARTERIGVYAVSLSRHTRLFNVMFYEKSHRDYVVYMRH